MGQEQWLNVELSAITYPCLKLNNNNVFSAKADIYSSLHSVKLCVKKEELILDCVIFMCKHF